MCTYICIYIYIYIRSFWPNGRPHVRKRGCDGLRREQLRTRSTQNCRLEMSAELRLDRFKQRHTEQHWELARLFQSAGAGRGPDNSPSWTWLIQLRNSDPAASHEASSLITLFQASRQSSPYVLPMHLLNASVQLVAGRPTLREQVGSSAGLY